MVRAKDHDLCSRCFSVYLDRTRLAVADGEGPRLQDIAERHDQGDGALWHRGEAEDEGPTKADHASGPIEE